MPNCCITIHTVGRIGINSFFQRPEGSQGNKVVCIVISIQGRLDSRAIFTDFPSSSIVGITDSMPQGIRNNGRKTCSNIIGRNSGIPNGINLLDRATGNILFYSNRIITGISPGDAFS